MECPACHNTNPSGSPYCGVCHEVLIHSAAKGIARAQAERRARFAAFVGRTGAGRPGQALLQWASMAGQRLGSWLYRVRFLFTGLAVLTLVTWVIGYVRSPFTQLKRHGIRLTQGVGERGATQYLVGTELKSRSWADRDGQFDTPLMNASQQETGSVRVERTAAAGAPAALALRPVGWIKTVRSGDQDEQTALPLTHGSLAPVTVSFGPQGELLTRNGSHSSRLGRVAEFLFPRFPSDSQRTGSHWQENVSWSEPIGEWRIHWDATLHWTLVDYESCYQRTCARLTYDAQLTPAIEAVPEWAKSFVGQIRFDGQAHGEGLYSQPDSRLVSNSFRYDGRLSIPLSSLESIPAEERVGSPLSVGPGRVMIDFSDRLDLRNP